MSQPGEFGFRFGQPEESFATQIDEDAPMYILVLGDFSGRTNRGALETPQPLAGRAILPIDLETFDERLARVSPRLELPIKHLGGPTLTVGFSSLDDFHPDRLFERVEVFAGLRHLRQELLDPQTFQQAVAALRQEVAGPSTAESASARPDSTENDVLSLGLVPGAAEGTRLESDIAQIVRGIVAPYILPKADPRQKAYVASIEEAIAGQMRRVLHHAAFQALEAAWRGLRLLLSKLDTGPQLKVFVLDVSQAELAADLEAAGGDPTATALYRRLIDSGVRTPGGHPWSLLVGDYSFGPSAADVELLAALGSVASQAGGPLLAAGAPQLLGCASVSETPDPEDWQPLEPLANERWQALRASRVAAWLGLAWPRVLLRLPYGSTYSPVEDFTFEELADPLDHEAFLWGNPAFAAAHLLAASFCEQGWSMTPGDRVDIEELPACIVTIEGEPQLVPCAEAYLSQRAADAIAARGLMPMLSHKNRSAVRVASFQSLADPPAPLRGAWD